MHSSHFQSAYVHHNGDYSGDFIIDDYPTRFSDLPSKMVSVKGKELFKIATKLIKSKKINHANKLDITLKGNRFITEKPDTIKMNSRDIVDLYLEKLRSAEIAQLEQMEFKQLLKRYSFNK